MEKDHPLWPGLNRLIFIVTALLGLKLIVYIVEEFLPMFGEIAGRLIGVLIPFIIAFIIAFLLEPIVVRVMKYLRFKRTPAAISTLVLATGIIGLVIFLIIARLYNELSVLASTLPNYHIVVDFINTQIKSLENLVNVRMNSQIMDAINSSSKDIANTVTDWAASGSKFLLGVMSALPAFLVIIVITVVATFFMSIYFPQVKRFFAGLVPLKWMKQTQVVSRDLEGAVFGFIRAQLILVSITGISFTLGLTILGNQYAVTLGIISAILDLLPIVGTGFIYIPWGIILLFTGAAGEGIKILVLYVIAISIRQFVEPKILSKGIGLHPLATLISMFVGLQLLGGIGIIVGPGIVIIYEAMRRAGIINYPRL